MNSATDSHEFTVDAFHRGDFMLVQPARRGHRAGTDAMMLAAAVPTGFSGRLADLGAGAGAAGLAVASRCPGATVVLVENSSEMADYARRSIAHPGNDAIVNRCLVIEADVTQGERDRRNSGLDDASFDFAIMNPPFNSAADRPSPDALRREAHVMTDEGLFERWIGTARWIVRPGGAIAVIARPRSLVRIVSALHPHFGRPEVKALHPRIDRPATRIVVRARRGALGDMAVMPPMILHEPGSHGFTQQADAVNNGRASLFGD